MSRERESQAVARLLRLLAERLEGYLAGDELAFETLGEAIEDSWDGSAEDLQAAAWVLRGLGGDLSGDREAAVEGAPGEGTQRVLSDAEREALSPEAWGYLIDLKRRGSLSPGQIERVLGLLSGSGARPVGVDLAREVASRVALEAEDTGDGSEISNGDVDLIH